MTVHNGRHRPPSEAAIYCRHGPQDHLHALKCHHILYSQWVQIVLAREHLHAVDGAAAKCSSMEHVVSHYRAGAQEK
jgi:hypothetical protein